MKGKRIIFSTLLLAYACCCNAQESLAIDLGGIREYQQIGNKLGYYISIDKHIPVDSLAYLPYDYSEPVLKFNLTDLSADYYIKANLENTGPPTDSFCLYVGQAIDFEVYEWDSASN